MTDFIDRLEQACARAEDEYPHLAAPDGTVAVPFADLRALLALNTRTPAQEGHNELDIRGIALAAIKRARQAGESQEMLARWISEDIRTALKTPGYEDAREQSEDTVERVARAIYERGGFPNPTWDDLGERWKEFNRKSARAALSALRGES